MRLVGYACFPTVENLGINAGGIRVFPHCRSLSNNALEASVKIGTFMLQEQAYMLQCWQVYYNEGHGAEEVAQATASIVSFLFFSITQQDLSLIHI